MKAKPILELPRQGASLRDLLIVAIVGAAIPAMFSLLSIIYLAHRVNQYEVQVDGVVMKYGAAMQAEGVGEGKAQGVEQERRHDRGHRGEQGERGPTGPPGPQGKTHWWNLFTQDRGIGIA